MPNFRLTSPILALALSASLLQSCVPSSSTPDVLQPATASAQWRISASDHTDLWLHGFALITTDTTPVPLFKRGYADSINAIRRQANVYSTLDANKAELAQRLNSTPALRNTQFLVFSFPSWESLSNAITTFLRVEGDASKAGDQNSAAETAFLASQFPTAADRTWLRRFFDGLTDEKRAFYQTHWTTTQSSRSSVIANIQSDWDQKYRARFERYLSITRQRNGSMLLSLPLGAEGRAASDRDGMPIVAVPMPGRVANVAEAFSVFAHELVGQTAATAVNDNTSPAEKRSGVSDRYIAFSQVRGGALLLERISPDLVRPYVQYYLAQGGHRPANANTDAQQLAALAAAYPLPQAIVDAIRSQIDISLGGI